MEYLYTLYNILTTTSLKLKKKIIKNELLQEWYYLFVISTNWKPLFYFYIGTTNNTLIKHIAIK